MIREGLSTGSLNFRTTLSCPGALLKGFVISGALVILDAY